VPRLTRRDFLNGVALAIVAGASPAQLFARSAAPKPYPPGQLGLRGSHPGSFEVAHALRDGARFDLAAVPATEIHDVVIVGAGLSGLSAALFWRQRQPRARILILDNHADFGGHALRNEFRVDRRLLLSYGGSESLQSPKGLWSEQAKSLLHTVGVDIARFETAFDRTLYPSLGLSRGVFFTREAFGEDRLVTGDPMRMVADDIPPERMNARSAEAFIADFPLSPEQRAQLVALSASSWIKPCRTRRVTKLPAFYPRGIGRKRRSSRPFARSPQAARPAAAAFNRKSLLRKSAPFRMARDCAVQASRLLLCRSVAADTAAVGTIPALPLA
jgi:spermidine dehydrogenase